MITDSLTSPEDRQTFKLNEAKPMLKEIQEADIFGRVTSTTQISEKKELHLGVLLTMVSPAGSTPRLKGGCGAA
jgi:hypothetical protein